MPTSKEDLLKQLKDELSKVNYKLPLLPLETIYALHIAKMLDKINEYQDTSHTKIDDEIKNVLKQHIKSIQDESGLKPQNIARENFFLNLYKTKDQKGYTNSLYWRAATNPRRCNILSQRCESKTHSICIL